MSSQKSNLQSPFRRELSFQYKARYYTIGPTAQEADFILFCLHGYGHLAPYFIKKFESISDRVCIIVPEGLHRFYLKGNSGRVGASWMTKEDRLMDIENYLSYLETIASEVMGDGKEPLNVLGFSQGAATAGRWVSSTSRPVANLILWSGMFPHDVDMESDMALWGGMNVYVVLGNEDPYLSDDRIVSELERMPFKYLKFNRIDFSGGHEIPSNVLQGLIDRILI